MNSIAPRWLDARRIPWVAGLIAMVAFVAAVALWAGSDDSRSLASPPTTVESSAPADQSASAGPSASPSPGGSASAGTLPPLAGLAGTRLPDRTQLTTLGPGNHRVVMVARSDQPMLAVGYAVKDEPTSRQFNNVRSPVTIVRTVSGGAPLATIALQIGPTATSGGCTITIDGKVVSNQRVTAPYGVTQCVG